jgi:BolA protein
MDMGRNATEIEVRLRAALAPTALEIVDDSESHRGHAGYDGAGESHFTVHITAAAFAGQSRIARQRLVYAALGDLMAPGGVHALIIKAKAPGEG